jgi:hypothetical protein
MLPAEPTMKPEELALKATLKLKAHVCRRGYAREIGKLPYILHRFGAAPKPPRFFGDPMEFPDEGPLCAMYCGVCRELVAAWGSPAVQYLPEHQRIEGAEGL